MNRNFAMEFVRVTEAAALSCAKFMGYGDEKKADQAAVDAMRSALNSVEFDGRVVIGEGERDEAPMLYIGEKVGKGGSIRLDLALDPLEGTTICARGLNNSISVIAIAEDGNFLHAPDCYMEKIAVGPEARGVISLERTATENLKEIAKVKKCEVSDLTAIILDRPRHENLIREVRESGARIWLIGDGDVSAAIATSQLGSGVDVLLGTGGAPEGVIAAAALRCQGGDFVGRLVLKKDDEIARARKMGIEDPKKIYKIEELAKRNVMFCATGVTQGTFLNGIRLFAGGAFSHSVVMRSETGTIRYIQTEHHFKGSALMAQAETEKTYEIDANQYFKVVTDYERYPEFVDGMKKVKAERAADGSITAHYELSMMSKDMSYTLKIQENAQAGTVNWSLLKSDFFKVNNGAWKIESIGPGKCKVRYSLEVEFNFSVPGLILKGMVKGTLPSMMNGFYDRAKKL